MNKLTFIIIGLWVALQAYGCPTCVNHISTSDKPFFSDDLEQEVGAS